jgi:hypothetical protein
MVYGIYPRDSSRSMFVHGTQQSDLRFTKHWQVSSFRLVHHISNNVSTARQICDEHERLHFAEHTARAALVAVLTCAATIPSQLYLAFQPRESFADGDDTTATHPHPADLHQASAVAPQVVVTLEPACPPVFIHQGIARCKAKRTHLLEIAALSFRHFFCDETPFET